MTVFKLNKNYKKPYNYFPKNKEQLKTLIGKLICERGVNANLNDIDTSYITDMSYLFWCSDFNGDISKWDVSKVTNMKGMFMRSKFNGDISKWDVSHVTYTQCMFYDSLFTAKNGDISGWDVSNIEDMSFMFDCSKFYGDLSKWNIKDDCNINAYQRYAFKSA